MDASFALPPRMPSPSDSLWSRLCYTSLSDALRGRVEGPLDARRVIAAFELGEELSAIVWQMVEKTRLWRSEKVDVARELASHFREGLDAGVSEEQLVEQFGDRLLAVALIRRAKIRGRARSYYAWKRMWQGVLLTVLGLSLALAAMALQFQRRKPTLSLNMLADARPRLKQVAEEERGWPLYRQAILDLRKDTELSDDELWQMFFRVQQGEESPAIARLVERHPEAIRLTLLGSQKKELGYRYEDAEDVAWLLSASHRLREQVQKLRATLQNNSLPAYQVFLPSVRELVALQRLLHQDAHLALAKKDGERLVDDLIAELNLLRQGIGAVPVNLSRQNGLYNDSHFVLELAKSALKAEPHFLSDTQLQQLKVVIETWRDLPRYPSLDVAEQNLEDYLQRYFTDDGKGDGRITAEGMAEIHWYETSGGFPPKNSLARIPYLKNAPTFVQARYMGTREEMREQGREFMRMERAYFQSHEKKMSKPEVEAFFALKQTVESLPYKPLHVFLEQTYGDRHPFDSRVQRDCYVALVIIALRQYHAERGMWPVTLEELAPKFLPTVPVDSRNGLSFVYRLNEGRPLLYSVGMNRRDDAGIRDEEFRNDLSYRDDEMLWSAPSL